MFSDDRKVFVETKYSRSQTQKEGLLLFVQDHPGLESQGPDRSMSEISPEHPVWTVQASSSLLSVICQCLLSSGQLAVWGTAAGQLLGTQK